MAGGGLLRPHVLAVEPVDPSGPGPSQDPLRRVRPDDGRGGLPAAVSGFELTHVVCRDHPSEALQNVSAAADGEEVRSSATKYVCTRLEAIPKRAIYRSPYLPQAVSIGSRPTSLACLATVATLPAPKRQALPLTGSSAGAS